MSRGGGGNSDVGLFVGFLDQHVYEGLLFVLGLSGDDGGNRCGRCWGLDEDDLVVFLGDGSAGDDLWALFFRFWGWDMDVDVFLDYGSSSEATSEAAAASGAETSAGGESSTDATSADTSADASTDTSAESATDTEAAGAQATGGEATAKPAVAATDAASNAASDAAPVTTETTATGRIVGVSRLGPRRADRRNGC